MTISLSKEMKIVLLLSMILLCGCQALDIKSTDKKTVDKEAICNEISHQVALKLMRDKGLIPCGSGGGAMHKVRMLALSFNYRKPLTIEGGRELMLTAVHEFTDAINADERIRPYLESYPFSPERVEIIIFVQDVQGASLPLSVADILSCRDGICRYETFYFEQKKIETVFKETLAEAEQRTQESALQTSVSR